MTRAQLTNKIEKLYEELNEQAKHKTVTDKIRNLHQNFEQLCFDISRMDGSITLEQLQQKSVYDFYRYKQMLLQYIKKRTKR